MKNKNLIIPITVFAILAIFFSVFYAFNPKEPVDKISETKTSQGEVTIDLTPQEYRNNILYFQIGLNTHSVNLENYNLREHIILVYDGKTESPKEVPKLVGHHNNGIMSFKTEYKPKEYLIKISGIPDVQERVLEWK